jgi:hypothetical protein
LFRSQRVNGAWYRAELAHELRGLGVEIERRTGRDGRFFEVAGVPDLLVKRWSRRTEVIERAAREFRERYGRAPRAGELAGMSVATRGTKTVTAQIDVAAAWRAVAEEYGLDRARAEQLFESRQPQREVDLRGELLTGLVAERSMVTRAELEARALEISAGVEPAARAVERVEGLAREGELVELEGGMWTTRELRELEQHALASVHERADQPAGVVSRSARDAAIEHAGERVGGSLSDEQRRALEVITGRGGVSVLIGEAGTGKGVVLGAARDAWERDGYRVIGTAVAGAAAQRLGSEAGMPETMTADALMHRVEHGRLELDSRSVVVLDEAGMADTRRLAAMIELTSDRDTKLVLAGDWAQLSSIGAGGLFSEITERAPSARLTEVYRANHEWERDAWGQLRDGNAERALAAYQAHDRLHLAETRTDAGERMVSDWAQTRQNHPGERVVMITDASNHELDRLNEQAQQQRADRGEIGPERVELPDRPYGLATGDEILFAAQQHVPGERRVENGTRGLVVSVDEPASTARVRTEESTPRDVAVDKQDLGGLRLAYAQHVYKAQGLTTDRALVLTGGWQTDREHAYVALSRAREQTDIYAARDDLGHQGIDSQAIDRLAQRIGESHAQEASVTREQLEPAGDREQEAAQVLERSRDATIEAHAATAEPEPTRGTAGERVRISQRYLTEAGAAREQTAPDREREALSAEHRPDVPRQPAERAVDPDRAPSQERPRISQRYTQQTRTEELPRDQERDLERERGPYGQRLHELIVSQQIEQSLDHDRGEGIEI